MSPTKTLLPAILFLAFAGLGFAEDPSPLWDRARVDALMKRIKPIIEEVRKATAENDPDKADRKIHEMVEEVDAAIETMSPESRPFMRLELRIVLPMLETTSEYFRRSVAAVESQKLEIFTIRSEEDLTERLNLVQELIDANTRSASVLGRTHDEIEEFVQYYQLDSDLQKRLRKEANRVERETIAPMRKLRETDAECFAGVHRVFSHLKKHWGHWKVTGPASMEWTDPDARVEFQSLSQALVLAWQHRSEIVRSIKSSVANESN